jgi:7-keto-8-aminopelargonate synthetase-like enzyme
MQGHGPLPRKGYFMTTPLDRQISTLAKTGMTRFFRRLFDDFPELLLKDVTVEEVGPDRTMRVGGRWLRNFGSDSFLGLDQHPRVKEAVERGVRQWGTHNGTSRAFSSVGPNVEAEAKIAAWLGTEAALVYPSVTLANVGALPGLATRHDLIVADHHAHNSIEEGMRVAKARGVRTAKFAHNDPADLERLLAASRPYRHAVVALDGVYSMSGHLPPLAEFQKVARANSAFLYVDDAHGTGVLGTRGRGTVRDALGNYDNTLVVGSLSKAVSCQGGFVAGPRSAVEVLKLRSNPLIFGGPVPPAYLVAVCAALDVIASPEYDRIRAALDANVRHLVAGANRLGLAVLGGLVPIVSVLVGEEEATLRAGRFLFDRGYYVQSVVFPAVPHGAGVLRMQVNANHSREAIDGLLRVLAELALAAPLPGPEAALLPFALANGHAEAIPA